MLTKMLVNKGRNAEIKKMGDSGNCQKDPKEEKNLDEPMSSNPQKEKEIGNEQSKTVQVKEEPIEENDDITSKWIFDDSSNSPPFTGEMKRVEVVDQIHDYTFPCQVPDYFGVDLEDRVSRNENTPKEKFHTIDILTTHMVILLAIINVFGKKIAERRPIYFYIIRERLDFSLDKYYAHISKDDGSSGERKRDHRLLSALFVQILKALQFLQEHDIIHRDISPKNIGVNQNGFLIKLIDFGCSRKQSPSLEHTLQPGADYLYQAPEMLAGKPYDTKVDIWSTAVVGIEMLGCKVLTPTGWSPHTIKADMLKRILKVCGWQKSDQYEQVYDNVFHDELGLRKPMLPQFEKEIPTKRLEPDRGPLTKDHFLDLVKIMLSVDPRKRPNAEKCLMEAKYLQVMNRKYDEVHNVPSPRESFLELTGMTMTNHQQISKTTRKKKREVKRIFHF
ncbi:unnamed protein product, partial [Mesorhabditis belari]|uniref:Protein kinase domain-containing protein n=1 Tax=Mesorhabditis belari TaxID=2138241 RepID=A0AAF3ES89_9BILA